MKIVSVDMPDFLMEKIKQALEPAGIVVAPYPAHLQVPGTPTVYMVAPSAEALEKVTTRL